MSVDHYEILGLYKYATADEIKKKYHAMVKEWHPDKYKGKNKKLAQQKISEINKSYEVLGNKQKRQVYDNEQEQENNIFMGFDDTDSDSTESSSSDSSIKNLHEFKQRLRELNEDMERTGMDERFDTDFDSSPEEGNGGYGGFFGSNYYAQQQAQDLEQKKRCNEYFEKLKKIGMDADANAHVTLEEIFTGVTKKVKITRRLVGDEEIEEYVDVNIKQNSNEGDSISVPNMGHFVNYNSEKTNTPGNASINIKIIPHDIYTRKDFDLYTTLEITFVEAQHGFKRSLKGLDGKTFHIALPSINRSDITHSIPHKGMRRESGSFGTLYVSYIIVSKLTDPSEKPKKRDLYSSESEQDEKPKKINKIKKTSSGGESENTEESKKVSNKKKTKKVPLKPTTKTNSSKKKVNAEPYKEQNNSVSGDKEKSKEISKKITPKPSTKKAKAGKKNQTTDSESESDEPSVKKRKKNNEHKE